MSAYMRSPEAAFVSFEEGLRRASRRPRLIPAQVTTALHSRRLLLGVMVHFIFV
ncbi:hypothetical protein H6G91_28260 [Nostoc muscorum FACHB-395]|nr:hypothetical protein [Desmonostoc muscorum FACHB-395]